MTNVLLMGFEPFGGDSFNPSWEAVSLLASKPPMDSVRLTTTLLPCVYGAADKVLRQSVAAVAPDIVIIIGQAGGRAAVTPERVAINVDDARIPDNAGNQPIDVPVVADGPAAYFTRLPIKSCVEAMRASGIPASVSQTAGTFLCNHTFYQLMHMIHTERPDMRGGFVHVPYAHTQVADKHHLEPSLSLATIANALGVIVQTCAVVKHDIKVVGGSVS